MSAPADRKRHRVCQKCGHGLSDADKFCPVCLPALGGLIDGNLTRLAEEAINDAYERGRKDMAEEAAKVADPPLMHRKGNVGLWRQRRAQIASDIRALIFKAPEGSER